MVKGKNDILTIRFIQGVISQKKRRTSNKCKEIRR